jgi:hypothetical protein
MDLPVFLVAYEACEQRARVRKGTGPQATSAICPGKKTDVVMNVDRSD